MLKTQYSPQFEEIRSVFLPPSDGTPSDSCRTILFFDHTAALGGGEIALLHLLQALDRSRFTPVVVLGEEGALLQHLRALDIETHLLPLAADVAHTRKESLGPASLLRLRSIARTLAYAAQLARFLRARQADLLHTNSLKADLIGALAARLAGIPVLWHVRDRIETDYLPAPVVHLFRRLCRLLPDYIIANSHATLDTLRLPSRHRTNPTPLQPGETTQRGAPRHRETRALPSRVVHDGVRPAASPLPMQAVVSTEKRDPPPAPHRPLVGLVGRISPWKGQHIFVQAAARIHARLPHARFQIIGSALFGEADYEAQVHTLVEQLALQECVEFLGFRSDVAALIAGLDVLVHASTAGEPFGQVVVEGMLAGKPVVATRGGGVVEIVEEGVTGVLVEMGAVGAMAEAVIALLCDPSRAQAMGQAGRKRVQQRFTIEQTARNVEDVYEDLFARARRRPRSECLKSDCAKSLDISHEKEKTHELSV